MPLPHRPGVSPAVTAASLRRPGRVWAAWPLAAILLGHWALSLGFNYVTPVFEGPDEPNHFLFIRYLPMISITEMRELLHKKQGGGGGHSIMENAP